MVRERSNSLVRSPSLGPKGTGDEEMEALTSDIVLQNVHSIRSTAARMLHHYKKYILQSVPHAKNIRLGCTKYLASIFESVGFVIADRIENWVEMSLDLLDDDHPGPHMPGTHEPEVRASSVECPHRLSLLSPVTTVSCKDNDETMMMMLCGRL